MHSDAHGIHQLKTLVQWCTPLNSVFIEQFEGPMPFEQNFLFEWLQSGERPLEKAHTIFNSLPSVELLSYDFFRQIFNKILAQISNDEQSIVCLPCEYVTEKKRRFGSAGRNLEQLSWAPKIKCKNQI